MIELERHIEILLLTNDCVIIPNFGGFMAHYRAAHFDERDKSFLPPTRTVGFNHALKLNDSLLAQSYVEAYDISYPEALRRIEQDTEELKQVLQNEGEYNLRNLGRLSLNNEGQYVFEPCEAGLLTPSLYGLSSFEFKKQKQCSEMQTEVETHIKETQPKAQILDFVVPEAIEETEEKSYTIRRSVVRNIAVACIAVLFFLLLPSTLSNGEKATMTGNRIDTNLLTAIMPKEVTIGNAANHITKDMTKKAFEAVIEGKIAKKSSSTEVEETNTPAKSYYSIVLASRVTRKNASDFVAHLHHKGYDEAKVLTQRNRTKVIYGQYDSEEAARKVVNKLHKKADFSDCWIIHIK